MRVNGMQRAMNDADFGRTDFGPLARRSHGEEEAVPSGALQRSPDVSNPDAGLNGQGWPHRERREEQRTGLALGAPSLPFYAAAIEFLAIAFAVYEASALYHRLMVGYFPYSGVYFVATLLLTAMFVMSSARARDYSIRRLVDHRDQLRSIFIRWNHAYLLFVFALFMTQMTDIYSRGSLVAQYAAGLAAALLVRFLIMQFVARGLRSGSLRGKKVVVAGEPDKVKKTVQRLRSDGQGSEIVAVFDVPEPASAARDCGLADGDPHTMHAITEFARHDPLDDIVLCFSWSENRRIREFVDGLASVPATVHLAADDNAGWTQKPVLARIGGVHTIRLSRAALTLKDRILKRSFDLAVASALLVAAAPFFVAIACLIKLNSAGPVFFRQRRNGFNQHEFRVFKFRTMTTLDDGDDIPQAVRNDSRVTAIGRILRATNLDELPQLFNVILGDMSLVGPRPHAVAHNNKYEEQIRLYARRHNVRPGITGWAQVNGFRGETRSIERMQRRVEHDLYYIDNWSLRLDIKILLMTIFSPRSYRNAY